MTKRYVIAGTDTGVGKTVFSAALASALAAHYWKPVQAGLEGETDSQMVARLSGLPESRILPEAWRLITPASPHIAARIDGMVIDADHLSPPDVNEALIIETAGGLLTPLTDTILTIDLLARWNIAVILCARTSLGTINHSLLSIEALRRRNIPVKGIAFIGDASEEVQKTIARYGNVTELGRLPFLPSLTRDSLRAAFAASFHLADFVEDAFR
jgi:dethiobiotin synthetase